MLITQRGNNNLRCSENGMNKRGQKTRTRARAAILNNDVVFPTDSRLSADINPCARILTREELLIIPQK